MKFLKLILITLISLAIYTPANAQPSNDSPDETTFKRKITTDKLQVMNLKDFPFLKSDENGNIVGGSIGSLKEQLNLGNFKDYNEKDRNRQWAKYVNRLQEKNDDGFNNPVKGLFIATNGGNYGILIPDIKGLPQYGGEEGSDNYIYPLYVRVYGYWFGIKGVKIESESH